MPQYLPLPDGSFVTVREGEQPADAWERAQATYPAAFGITPQEPAEAPAPKRTLAGQAKEFAKGLPTGAINLLESAGTGAAALLPDQMEQDVRGGVKRVAEVARSPFTAAPGYEDSTGAKLGQAVGSTLPFLAAGPFGMVGRAGAAALGVGAGAGEARTRAEGEGATGDQRGLATALGAGVGLSEIFAPFRILARIPDTAQATGVNLVRRALQAGGEEAAQEAAAGWAQNLIAQQIYKPEQELIEGLGEQAAYGGATGALIQGVMDLALGRRARAGAAADEQAKQAAAAQQEAQRAAAEEQRLQQVQLEAERAAPAQTQPFFESPQGTLPGMEAAPPAPAPAPEAEDPAQRAGFLRATIPQIDARMDELRQANLQNPTLAQRQEREGQMQKLRDARLLAQQELEAMALPDSGQVQAQVAKLQKKLEKADSDGDTTAALKLALQIDALGGAQESLDLGPARRLTDPAENARRATQQTERAAQQEELGQRQEDLRAQRTLPDDQTMDMFAESTADVEAQRATGETNFDYLDPIFEKAFEGQPGAVKAPQSVQPTPNADEMLRRLNELEERRASPKPQEKQAATREFEQLTGAAGAPMAREIARVRQQQSEALNQIENRLDQLRSGQTPRGAYALRNSDNRRATAAKQAYVTAALEEAAILRRARNAPPLSTNEALRAANEIDTALEELLTRGQAVPVQALVFDQDATGTTTARKGDPRDLDQRPFAKYGPALSVIFEQVKQARDRAGAAPAARAERPLLRTQFAESEAQRVATESGETAKTAAGRDRREQEFIDNQLTRLEQSGRSAAPLRNALGTAPTQEVRALVREIADRMIAGQPVSPEQRRDLAQAVRAARAGTPDQPGQKDIFDTGAVKAEQRDIQARITAIDKELEGMPTTFKNGKAAAQAFERRNILGRAKEQLQRRLEGTQEQAKALQTEGEQFRGETAFTRANSANFLRALESSPEVKKARAAVLAARTVVQEAARAPATPPIKVRIQRETTTRESGPNQGAFVSGTSTDPEIQRAIEAVAAQRARLMDSVRAAQDEAVAADQKARDVVYKPAIAAARKRLTEAQNELQQLTSWPYVDESGESTQPYVVLSLRDDIAAEQTRLDELQQGATSRADATMGSYAVAQDSVVALEKAILADMDQALERLISGVPNIAQQREMSRLAAEQRARVAVEEKRARDIADERAKNRLEFEQRLRSGDGLPTIRPEDRRNNKGLKARYDALTAAIETPDPRIVAAQEQLAEMEAQPNPDTKAKRKMRDVQKRLEQYRDQDGAKKERLEQQRREVAARMGSTQYLTQQERDARAEEQKRERELGTALDAIAAQPFTARRRATGPVTRDQGLEPRVLRTGSEESRTGVNAPRPKAVGLQEATRPSPSRRAVSPDDITEANRIAAELKALSPAAKAQQAKEAEAVAKEMAKSAKAAKPDRGSRVASAIEETDTDFEDLGDSGLDMGVGDALFRENNAFYDERATAPLQAPTVEAANDGRILDVLDDLANYGSQPWVVDLALKLKPLLMRTKLRVDANVALEGESVAGLYMPNTNTIVMHPQGLTEADVLHEMTHAATLRALQMPEAQLSDSQRQARAELEVLFNGIQNDPLFEREYGRTTLPEFVAEVMTNTTLQQRLDTQEQGQKSRWQRFKDAVLRLLGVTAPTASARAQASVERLFMPSQRLAFTQAGVASVMRGVFPATKPEFNADVPASVQSMANTVVGRDPTLVDKVMANLSGLALRTQYLDRFAPVERLLRMGVERGTLTQMQAFQTNYFLRYGEQRSQFVEQAANVGVPQLVKHSNGEFTIETPDTADQPNLGKIARVLSGANVGNEVATERLFTNWLAVLRAETPGVGYGKLNTDKEITPQMASELKAFVNADPKRKAAFEEARALYRSYNNSLLDLMAQTGAMEKTEVARLKQGDYVPYYREQGGVVELIVAGEKPMRIGNIADQPYLKELVGDNTKILPFFTGAMQNTSMLIDMALRNQQTKDVAMVLKEMGVATIGVGDGPTDTRSTVRFKVDGERRFARIENATEEYGVPAELLVQGLQGIKTTLPAVLRLMQLPANVLRLMITRAPAYALRQIIREPINAWLTTGGNFTPIVSSVQELSKILQNKSTAATTLERSGAVSSNVITGDAQDQARILRDIAQGKTAWDKVMMGADKFAMQGDTATRAVLYDKFRKQGMTHMQALLGSLESMNFMRRGLSPSVQMMSMLVPFFNAQVQGMDVIYRSMKGDATLEKQLDVRRKLFKRGLMVSAGTMAYALLMGDDEAYKNATPEQRALNWFVRLPGVDEPLRIPIPFELGYIFKVLPEMTVNMANDDLEAGEAMKTFRNLLWQTVPFGLPQAIKPSVEVLTNYSLYTGSSIESTREQSRMQSERYRDNTTEIAKILGQAGVASPVQIDYLVRGYFGGLGLSIMSLPNFALRPLNSEDVAVSPTMRASQMPLLGPLFQPNDGRAVIDEAYKDVESFQQASNTFKDLVAAGRRADAMAFAQKYSNEIALNAVGGQFRQQMGELAQVRRALMSRKDITAEEKRAQLDQLRQVEIALARRVRAAANQPS